MSGARQPVVLALLDVHQHGLAVHFGGQETLDACDEGGRQEEIRHVQILEWWAGLREADAGRRTWNATHWRLCSSMSISPCHLSLFPPEFQLACVCCRPSPTAADYVEMRRLLGIVDVPTFVGLVVSRHRIGPLVYAALKRLPAEVLPPGLMAPLAGEARSNSVKALRAVRTHVLLDRWFRAAGIDWLPFKGSTLALRYYGDISLRQVNDQDVWVPIDKLEQAREVLAGHGYCWDPRETCWDLAQRGPRHRKFLLRYFWEEQQLSEEHGRIELHWQLTDNLPMFRLQPAQLLSDADQLPLGGSSLRVMNSSDLLLYLCEHGSRHCWTRLKWLADLPRLLERQSWDWPRLLERARESGCLSALLIGLSLARDLFGWTPPRELERPMDSLRFSTVFLGLVRTGLLAPASWWAQSGQTPEWWLLRVALSRLLLQQDWRARLDSLWRLSVSPHDLRLFALPERLFFLYQPLRPLLLVMRRWRKLRKSLKAL